MKQLLYILVLLFLTQISTAQELDSLVFQKIADKLIDQSVENYLDKDTERRGDCVYSKKEGFTLSCINAHWDKDWHTDLDGDGNDDLLIQVGDEGLGGGGNAFGFNFEIVTLDENKDIKGQYSLFGGGKLSYALLSIDKIENGTIYATYQQNPAAYGFEDVTYENAEQISLEFTLENDLLLEKSYKNCPVAAMNKAIFRNDINFEIKRTLSLNDAYNLEQTENLILEDGSVYYASFNGCEDIEIYFSRTIPYDAALKKDKNKIKNTWVENVLFLKENTRYTSILNEALTQLNNFNSLKLQLDDYGGTNIDFTLKNNWTARLFLSGNEEQGTFVTIRLDKRNTDEALDFWESFNRKQRL